MTEETAQAVVETTNAEATPSATEANAQGSDLESFLTEYEAGTKPQTPPVQAATPQPDPAKEVLAEIQTFRQERAAEKNKADIAELIKTVKGEFDLPNSAVRGWIDEKGENNPALVEIWNNRETNPAAAKRMVQSMIKDFAREQNKGKVDPNVTADVHAVAAAVRGASIKAPPQSVPKLGSMTNHQYNEWLREQGINHAV